jgi:hypothetical protein
MPSNNQIRERRALLWQIVERLLFCPANDRDRKTWCVCFFLSLADYWGIGSFLVPSIVFPTARFNLPLPDFSISYDLSECGNNPQRSSLQMIFKEVKFASYDIDHTYHGRDSLSNPPSGGLLSHYPKPATRNSELMEDICWVLERFILHPCTHLHLIDDVLEFLTTGQDNRTAVLHEIRLGLGIANPFAALFQFRMNFLIGKTPEDTKVRKQDELHRIAQLVLERILAKNYVQPVPPANLFNYSIKKKKK